VNNVVAKNNAYLLRNDQVVDHLSPWLISCVFAKISLLEANYGKIFLPFIVKSYVAKKILFRLS